MNIRYPIYEGVYRILTLYIGFLEELSQNGFPVRTAGDAAQSFQVIADAFGFIHWMWNTSFDRSAAVILGPESRSGRSLRGESDRFHTCID